MKRGEISDPVIRRTARILDGFRLVLALAVLVAVFMFSLDTALTVSLIAAIPAVVDSCVIFILMMRTRTKQARPPKLT
jgi:Flp pilus assembly protein TadB